MEKLIALLMALAVIYPMWTITGRAGYSPWWSLVCVVPFGIVVLLWVIAFRPRLAEEV